MGSERPMHCIGLCTGLCTGLCRLRRSKPPTSAHLRPGPCGPCSPSRGYACLLCNLIGVHHTRLVVNPLDIRCVWLVRCCCSADMDGLVGTSRALPTHLDIYIDSNGSGRNSRATSLDALEVSRGIQQMGCASSVTKMHRSQTSTSAV